MCENNRQNVLPLGGAHLGEQETNERTWAAFYLRTATRRAATETEIEHI